MSAADDPAARTGREAAVTAIRGAAAAILDAARERDPTLAGAEIVAIGWATVELDRAERELGKALDAPLETERAPRDAELGATVRASRALGPGAPVLLLLEPDTEGWLAALLARHGEGVLAIRVGLAATTRTLTHPIGRGATSDPGE